MPKLTNEIIEAAIAGFEGQKHKIDAQIAELRAMLNPAPASTAKPEQGKKKRKFSAATLKHMREAQRLRWAKVKGESARAARTAPKPKRRLSAAGKANIVAALKKRWATKRAAKG
jgi:hypothetical protein